MIFYVCKPLYFVPTRARGLAGCVNMHIFLITIYSNLQAEINRCRNYLGTEINWDLYRRERMISVGFESILEKKNNNDLLQKYNFLCL